MHNTHRFRLKDRINKTPFPYRFLRTHGYLLLLCQNLQDVATFPARSVLTKADDRTNLYKKNYTKNYCSQTTCARTMSVSQSIYHRSHFEVRVMSRMTILLIAASIVIAAPKAIADGNGDGIPELGIPPKRMPMNMARTGGIRPRPGTDKSPSGPIVIFPQVDRDRIDLFSPGGVELHRMSLDGWRRLEAVMMEALAAGEILSITGTSDTVDFKHRSSWKAPKICAEILRIDFALYRKQARLSLARTCDFVVKIFGLPRAANLAAEGRLMFRPKINHPFRALFVTVSARNKKGTN